MTRLGPSACERSRFPAPRGTPMTSAFLAAVLAMLAACGARQAPEPAQPMDLLAVLPIEVVQPAEGVKVAEEELPAPVPEDAGDVVTAQIYAALTESSKFRFVPDLTVAPVLHSKEVRRAETPVERALALGQETDADGVIFGKVTRFRERVGTELGARTPASVSIALKLVDVHSGKVVWHGSFDQTQEPLSYNLLKFWMFWQGGPRWLTAAQLSRIGVDRLVKEMQNAVGH